jgi:glutamyl-tRNA synthetase
MLDPEEFVAAAVPFLRGGEPARAALEALAVEVRDRVRTLAEVDPMIDFVYLDEPVFDEGAWDKTMVKGRNVPAMLDATVHELGALDEASWRPDGIRAAVESAAVAAGLVNAEGRAQLSKAQGPVRVAVSGRTVGPPLFESLAVLGRTRTLGRLAAARSRLG